MIKFIKNLFICNKKQSDTVILKTTFGAECPKCKVDGFFKEKHISRCEECGFWE